MTIHSLYKTVGNVSFEKPHVDPVTLKPVFNERISFSAGSEMTAVDVKKFTVEMLNVAAEVDEIRRFFYAHEHDENALRKFVAEYQ